MILAHIAEPADETQIVPQMFARNLLNTFNALTRQIGEESFQRQLNGSHALLNDAAETTVSQKLVSCRSECRRNTVLLIPVPKDKCTMQLYLGQYCQILHSASIILAQAVFCMEAIPFPS